MSATAFWSLIRTQLLTALSLNSFVLRGKRGKVWLATVGLVVCLAPTYIAYVVMLVKAFAYLQTNNLPLEDLLLIGIYALSLFMIFFAGIPTIYATLFQSNDLSILLPLPYKPWQVLAAKLTAVYVPELAIGWAFFLPAYILYHVHGIAGWPHLIATLPGLLLLPAIPLAVAAIACILILNIPGIGRSKWFWYLGLTTAMIGVSLVLSASMAASEQSAISDLVQVRMRQMAQVGRLLPGAQFAMGAVVETGWAGLTAQAAHIGIVIAYCAALFAVGGRLYIGPILRGTSSTTRSGRRAEEARTRGFTLSYMRKEMLCTLKEPAVAMNGLGGYIALPILAITYSIMKWQTKGKVDVIGQMEAVLRTPEFNRHLPFFVVGIALGLALFGSMSSLFSASYSKDGKRLWVEKTLPVPPFAIYLSKLVSSYAIVSMLNAMTIAFFMFVIPFGPLAWLYVLALSQIVIAWSGAAGLAIDSARPKLVWKDAVQAVKQNMNVVLGLFVTMAGLGLSAVLLKVLFEASASPAVVYVGAMVLNILFLLGALCAGRAASARLGRIHV